MTAGYPHMIRMKEVLRKRGIKRLGSADSAVKKLKAVGETRWVSNGRVSSPNDTFYRQAEEAIQWLIEHCTCAWRYGAQYRAIDGDTGRVYELRHKVQFEDADQSLMFKLSYRA